VESVDADSQTVYLKLEGACGSCSSSTVTMQMGIERVLKEKYPNLREVLQVEDDRESKPTALDFAAVQAEIGRLAPAISAMGGLVELMSVDPELGVVQVTFRGSNKVQKGLELALLDVPFVKHIKFTMGEK
jgi:Fe-S cluster biogenesis protein NfuA